MVYIVRRINNNHDIVGLLKSETVGVDIRQLASDTWDMPEILSSRNFSIESISESVAIDLALSMEAKANFLIKEIEAIF